MWAASFTPLKHPGEYRLEVLNHWVIDSVSPNATACDVTPGLVWEGVEPWYPPKSLVRRKGLTPCCDLCGLYEQCQYWTCVSTTVSKFRFFRGINSTSARFVSPTHPPRGELKSGFQTSETQARHLGGFNHESEETPEQCRQQAHVFNSPQVFTVGVGAPPYEHSDTEF